MGILIYGASGCKIMVIKYDKTRSHLDINSLISDILDAVVMEIVRPTVSRLLIVELL